MRERTNNKLQIDVLSTSHSVSYRLQTADISTVLVVGSVQQGQRGLHNESYIHELHSISAGVEQ